VGGRGAAGDRVAPGARVLAFAGALVPAAVPAAVLAPAGALVPAAVPAAVLAPAGALVPAAVPAAVLAPAGPLVPAAVPAAVLAPAGPLVPAAVPAAVLAPAGVPAPAGVLASLAALGIVAGRGLGAGARRCPGGPPGALLRSATSVPLFIASSPCVRSRCVRSRGFPDALGGPQPGWGGPRVGIYLGR
jgi:hypothetical protein